MFTDMIAALQKKMAGFSRRETNMYYQSIMNKAWEQVKNAPREKLPEELASIAGMAGPGPRIRKQAGAPMPMTRCSCRAERLTGTSISRSAPREAGGARVPGKGFGQTVSGAAADLVQSLQVFSGALLGDSAAFTSAITQVTNPPPVSASSGSGGHSSGGAAAPVPALAPAAPAPAPEAADEDVFS